MQCLLPCHAFKRSLLTRCSLSLSLLLLHRTTAGIHPATQRVPRPPPRSPLLPPPQNLVAHLRKNHSPLPRSMSRPQPSTRGQGWSSSVQEFESVPSPGEFGKRHQAVDGKGRDKVQGGQRGGGTGREFGGSSRRNWGRG